jgi:hypothetical protein
VVRAKDVPDWIVVIYKGVVARVGRGSTVMIQWVCDYDTGAGAWVVRARGGTWWANSENIQI